MKRPRALIIVAPILVLVLLIAPVQSQKDPGPAYKSVHLLTLSSSKDETTLVTILGEFNKLYAQLGYQDIQYRVWKISGKQSGEFTHLWESEWPDKATYDQAHGHKEFDELRTRFGKEIEELIKDQVYNRYEEVSVAPSKE